MPPIVAQGRRGPVVVYAPNRRVPAQRRPAATRRTNATNPQAPIDPGALDRAIGQARQSQAQAQAEEEQKAEFAKSFWGHGPGQVLGTVIKPLSALSVPMKAIQLAREEGAKALPEWAETLGGVAFLPIDEEKVRKDERSNWEKISPTSTYGGGEITKSTGNYWADSAIGFLSDVAFDPLTYIAPGATKLGVEAAKVGEQVAAREIAQGATREAAESAARAATRKMRTLVPHNAQERLQYITERVMANPELATKYATDIEQGLKQGLTRMSPEARQAFGDISKPGLYVRGTGGRVRIPGTGLAGEAVARGGAATRNALARVPADPGTKLGAIRNWRVGEGTEELYNTLIRGQGGDMTRSILAYGGRQNIRVGEGAATALSNRTLSNFYKDTVKKIGKGRVRQMFVEAQTIPESNPINQMYADVLGSFEEVAGRSIDPDYLQNPATYVPLIMTPGARRAMKDAVAKGDQAALDFIHANGFTADDLLEQSGHLAKARTMKTGAELKMGDHTVRIPDGTIGGLNANEDLRAAFPGFKGDFFMTDPVQIGEAYATSLGRQAGKEYAQRGLVDAATKFGLGGTVEGPLAEAFQASEAARAAQDPRIAVIEAGFQPGATSRPDWLNWAGEDPIAYGFKGEQGSTYVVRPDGSSVRNRAAGARGAAAMEGDTELAGGVQEAFDRVAFVDADDAVAVARTAAAGLKPVDEQGRLIGLTVDASGMNMETFNRARGSGMSVIEATQAAGGKINLTPIAASEVPAVGKTPLEYMLNGSRVHPGHAVTEVFDAAKAPKSGGVLADIGPTPVIPGSAQDIADRQAYADWVAGGSVGEAPVPPRPAYEAAGINPEDYFTGKESAPLTQARNDVVMQQGKALVNAVRKDAAQAETKARSFLSGIRKNLMRGLGKSLKEDAPAIKLLDQRLDNATKRLAQINVQRPQDQADLVQMIFESRQTQRDLEQELIDTNKTFDALNKKTTKKVIAKMQSQLRQLKEFHARAVEKMETMPARMKAEAQARLDALNEPIRKAEAALKAKTATVEGAVSDEAYRQAQATVRIAGMNSSDYDHLVDQWEVAVHNNQEALLNAPRKNGKLTVEGQRMIARAAADQQDAWKRLTIGREGAGGAEIPKAESPYLNAQTRLKQIEAQLASGRRDGVAPIEPVQVFIEDAEALAPVQGPVLPTTVRGQLEAAGFEYRVGLGWHSDDYFNIAKQVKVHKPSQVSQEVWEQLSELAEQTRQGVPGRKLEQVGQNITETFWNVDYMSGRVRWEANSPAEALAKVQEHRAMHAAEALRRSMRDAKGRFVKRAPTTPQQAEIAAIDAELKALPPRGKLSPQQAQRKVDLTARKKVLAKPTTRTSMTGAEAEAARARRAAEAPAVPEAPVAPEVSVTAPQLEPAEWAHTRDILGDELMMTVDEANLDQIDAIYNLSDQDTATFVQQMWPDLPDTAKHRLGELGWVEAEPSAFGQVWEQFMDAPPADGFVGAVKSGSEYQAYRRFLAGHFDDDAFLSLTKKDLRKFIRENFEDLPPEFQEFYRLRDTTIGESPATAVVTGKAARRRAARGVEQSVEDAAAELGETPIGQLTPNVLTEAEIAALKRERQNILKKMRHAGPNTPAGSLYEEKQAWETILNRLEWDRKVAAATEAERAAVAKARAYADQVQESMIFRSTDTGGMPSMERVYPQTAGEHVGFGVGEERLPVEVGGRGGVEHAPQPEAFQDVVHNPVTHQVIGAPPSPRTEREALAALQHAAEFPGAARAPGGAWVNPVEFQQARIEATHAILADPSAEAGRINQAARDEATSEIQAAMEATADDYNTDIANIRQHLNSMDDETLALRYQTQEDLKNLAPLKAKRESLTSARDVVKAADPNRTILDLEDTLSDIGHVARANPDMVDRDMNIVESLLNQHAENLARTSKNMSTAKDIASMVERPDKLAKMTVVALNDNLRLLHAGVVGPGSQFLDKELYRMFTNTYQIANEPTLFGRVFNAITNVWKTYATLSPGFQIRNALSGIFMNTADGVPLLVQLEGARKWREFVKAKNPTEWLASQPDDIQRAFHAAGGAGAGGRFAEAGFAEAGSSRDWWNAVMSNKATRWAQRFGSKVEGSLRLPAALDSIRRGESVTTAMTRVAKLHFDYSQVSRLDKTMKRIFPFWTFMSRNLPLQIEMMWTKPRAYAYYESFKRNFQQEPDPFTPDYWNRLGAWNTGLKNPLSDTSVYVQPDFGFTRVESDVKDILDFVTNKRPGALLSNVNPLLSAPTDYIFNRDSFYNRNFDETDYRERGGISALPINLLANNPIGQRFGITNEQGEISDNFWNMYTSLVPVADRANRLFPTASGGDTARTAEMWQRFLGLPPYIRTLSPTLQKSEFYRQKDEATSKIRSQRAAIERMLQAAG